MKTCLKGFAISPTSNIMSVLTTEMYGSIALLTLLQWICTRSWLGLLDSILTVEIVIDNKELVERFNNRTSGQNLTDRFKPGFDNWILLWDLRDSYLNYSNVGGVTPGCRQKQSAYLWPIPITHAYQYGGRQNGNTGRTTQEHDINHTKSTQLFRSTALPEGWNPYFRSTAVPPSTH